MITLSNHFVSELPYAVKWIIIILTLLPVVWPLLKKRETDHFAEVEYDLDRFEFKSESVMREAYGTGPVKEFKHYCIHPDDGRELKFRGVDSLDLSRANKLEVIYNFEEWWDYEENKRLKKEELNNSRNEKSFNLVPDQKNEFDLYVPKK